MLLGFQPYHAALIVDLKAAAKGPLAVTLHGGHPALKAPRFPVLVWHTGWVTKHPITLFILGTIADPEGFLGQQQIVIKNNALAALARHIRAGIRLHVADKMIGLPPPKHITAGQHTRLFRRQPQQLGEVKMGIHQRCNIIGDMNGQPDGALIIVGLEGINALAIYLGRVVVEMLLHIKNVLTKSG